jgi:two-component system, chemotaxis family, protein-glutamate methylesterase/glutaminase
MSFSRDVIVVGASAGGLEALCSLLSYLPPDLQAYVYVVQHISPSRKSEIPLILSRHCPLPVRAARGGIKPQRGEVYIAPPNQHLLVKRNVISLGNGPKENRVRPSVDVLFRSAAHSFGERVIGIILSGNLNDGTAGLHSIKTHGGIALVQDPNEAAFRGMPESAINFVQVDHVLPLVQIAAQIISLVAAPHGGDPQGIGGEDFDAADDGPPGLERKLISPPSALTCPACGGAIWESIDNGINQFGCHQGHVFTREALIEGYDEQLETVSYVMLRLLEENIAFRKRLAEELRKEDKADDAELLDEQVLVYEQRIALYRQMLYLNGAGGLPEAQQMPNK